MTPHEEPTCTDSQQWTRCCLLGLKDKQDTTPVFRMFIVSCLRLALRDRGLEGWSALLTKGSQVTFCSALTTHIWLSS